MISSQWMIGFLDGRLEWHDCKRAVAHEERRHTEMLMHDAIKEELNKVRKAVEEEEKGDTNV